MIKFLLDEGINTHRHIRWDDVREHVKSKTPFYMDIVRPDKEDIESLRSIFHFHPTNLEDCTFFSENPKLEEHKNYVFTVIHSIVPDTGASDYRSYDVHIFLSEDYIITVHDIDMDVIKEAHDRILNGNEVRELKCEYIYYTILDSIVDSYFPVLSYWSGKIDDIEEHLFDSAAGEDAINKIVAVRKELLKFKRIVMPQKEIVYKLTHMDVNFIGEGTRIYLRDVFDHTVDIYNSIEEHRDVLSNLMDAHFSKTSAALNEVMKKLTVISTIFMPLTFIVGIYGMNFKHMPELEWSYGYYLIMIVMFLAAGGFLVYFKRKKWF